MTRFPQRKQFAFSVFDDTDGSTRENIEPVYHLLEELDMRITKSVWPLGPVPGARIGGTTLENRHYLDFILRLQERGFEIALHNVQNSDATRDVIEKGFGRFQDLIGQSPRIHCNHSMNRDNIYWGATRFKTASVRLAYNIATRCSRLKHFQGDVEESPYFWGDLCKARIAYVRNFVFDEINLDRINPTLPYHDPDKRFVNFWFSSSEGGTVNSFCKTVSEANQDRLASEGGVCIMYAHFAKGFSNGGRVDPNFERLMRRLRKMNGWFVPVSELLDHLRAGRTDSAIPAGELARMERKWFFSKLAKGTT